MCPRELGTWYPLTLSIPLKNSTCRYLLFWKMSKCGASCFLVGEGTDWKSLSALQFVILGLIKRGESSGHTILVRRILEYRLHRAGAHILKRKLKK